MYRRQLKYLDLILKNKCVPHAFLFHSRDGFFIKETAKNFFVKLNEFGFAESITAEINPDVFFARPEEGKKDISVAQVARLRKFASQTPSVLKIKGIFIEEAQRMNEEGWNGLLKTLEEPAANTVIFILTDSVKNIPKTILSRAVYLSFVSKPQNLKPNLKDDIIISKLAGLGRLSLLERFDLAEEMSQKENLADILDDWMLDLRFRMLQQNGSSEAKILAGTAKLKERLLNTNINPRLALENLFLRAWPTSESK